MRRLALGDYVLIHSSCFTSANGMVGRIIDIKTRREHKYGVRHCTKERPQVPESTWFNRSSFSPVSDAEAVTYRLTGQYSELN